MKTLRFKNPLDAKRFASGKTFFFPHGPKPLRKLMGFSTVVGVDEKRGIITVTINAKR